MIPFLGLVALGVAGLAGAAVASAISDEIEEKKREDAKWEKDYENKRYERELKRQEEIQANANNELNAIISTLNENHKNRMQRSHERIKELNELINNTLKT